MKTRKLTTVLLIIILAAGLSLLLYPSFSNYWNSKRATKTISMYTEALEDMSVTEKELMWQEAVQYNKNLFEQSEVIHPT